MRVEIVSEKCQGHGRCVAAAPDVFDTDDEGNGFVLKPDVDDSESEDVLRAVGNCPENAVRVRKST